MNRAAKPLLLCLASAMLASGAEVAITNGSLQAYEVILKRNPFGLHSAPPPRPETPPPQPAPLNEVTLTGIASMMGRTKAYLATKQRGRNEVEYLSLAANETVGALEILAIDERAGTVKIKNAGRESVLNFKDNGVKTVSSSLGLSSPMPVPVPAVSVATPAVALPTPGVMMSAAGRPTMAAPPLSASSAHAPVLLAAVGHQSPGPSEASTPSDGHLLSMRKPRITLAPSLPNEAVPHCPLAE